MSISAIGLQQSIVNPHFYRKGWNERAIAYMNAWDTKLDAKMPNFAIQDRIDEMGQYLTETLASLTALTEHLDSDNIAIFLLILPARAVCNIVSLFYSIIKNALYFSVHPLKEINHLAKNVVSLAHQLTLLETWSKMGAGMIGGTLGQALVLSHPVSLFGIGLGVAMLVGSLSIASLKAAIYAEGESKKLIKPLLESFVTGFAMGLLIGAVQRAATPRMLGTSHVKAFADKFVKENHLPQYSDLTVDPSGKITLQWHGYDRLADFQKACPNIVHSTTTHIEFPTAIKIEFLPGAARLEVAIHGWDGFEGYDYIHFEGFGYDFHSTQPLEKIGLVVPSYP